MNGWTTAHGFLAAFLLAGIPLPACAAVSEGSSELIETLADALRPGQYLWDPRAPAGVVNILVNLPRQRAYVYRGGVLIGLSTISTGKPGHETPIGEFTILEKKADHRSTLYDDAPMPFMQRLTWQGVAIHGGKVPGYRASHGCVRVPLAFARELFAATKLGSTVQVIDADPTPRAEPPRPEPSWLDKSQDDYVTGG